MVHLHFVGGHRFHFDDFNAWLYAAVVADKFDGDVVGFVGIARPVDLAAGAFAVAGELFQVVVEMRERMRLDLTAGLAKVLPVGHLFYAQCAFAADDVRGVCDVAAKLIVLQRGLCRDREVGCFGGLADDDAQARPPVDSRISARCNVRTFEPERCRPP